MKRFLFLLAVIMLFCGIRIADRGLLRLADEGKLTYSENGEEVQTFDLPVINRIDGYYRFDVAGISAAEAIKKLNAKLLWSESFDNVTVYYAYSPYLKSSVFVRGRQVNLMLAAREDRLAAGTPLLKGSY